MEPKYEYSSYKEVIEKRKKNASKISYIYSPKWDFVGENAFLLD